MRNRLSTFAIVSGLIAAATASAPARAAENAWACEVMLCASNPGGWMQFSQCVPPIKKLLTHLALGGGFPTCTSAGVRGAKYTKPKDGRPGIVVMTMTDGSRSNYVLPSSAQVAQAEVGFQSPSDVSVVGLAQ